MPTIVTHVAGFKHIQVYDVTFDVEVATITHSMNSDLLKVGVIVLGTRSAELPGVTFDTSNQLTLEPTGIGDVFRVFIENAPIL